MSNEAQQPKPKTDTLKNLLQLVIAFLVLAGMMWGAVTFFTPRAVFDQACANDRARDKARQERNEQVQNKMREIQKLEREISRLERKILQYTLEWQGNSSWLLNLEDNWPNEENMSSDLRKEKKRKEERQDKIKRKLERYEEELEDMEKAMEALELEMEQLKVKANGP